MLRYDPMAHCIPTYMLASGLIGAGMSLRQALFTILLQHHVLAPSFSTPMPGRNRHSISRISVQPIPSDPRAGSDAALGGVWMVRNQAWIGGQAFTSSSIAVAVASRDFRNVRGHTPTE